jgi:FkbM family methyltransferase
MDTLASVASTRGLIEAVRLKRAARRQPRRMEALYSHFLAPEDLCFDVGANVGDRVAVMRSVGARVVAIEPQPTCIAALRDRFSDDPEVTILPVGLAEEDGSRELQISNASTLSSMSEGWIESMRSSGRFSDFSWEDVVEVPVTTLESAIAEHGRPRFCKIDVEGYEAHVLGGLHSPIEALSFEYAHEARENAYACMARLDELADYEFCFSPGESMELNGGWHPLSEQQRMLERMPDPLAWGDVYARAAPASG